MEQKKAPVSVSRTKTHFTVPWIHQNLPACLVWSFQYDTPIMMLKCFILSNENPPVVKWIYFPWQFWILQQQEPPLVTIMYLANLLETCEFKRFWSECDGATSTLFAGIAGFKDSIRKYICHILRITYQTIDRQQLGDLLGYLSDQELNQWMNKYGWKPLDGNRVFISQQEESIKTKNITEKISFESVASVMKLSQWNQPRTDVVENYPWSLGNLLELGHLQSTVGTEPNNCIAIFNWKH